MEWEKENVNYWENPDCPIQYLRDALVNVVDFVQGERPPYGYVERLNRESLCTEIAFFEDVADK